MAIDVKTLRRSHDQSKGLGALHVVSAWATEMGLSLGQIATDQHSNEITAIPELLKLIYLEGTIITIDAMGTQTAIAEQIVAGKADYVLAVKGNQEGSHQTKIAYIDRQMESDFRNCGARRHVTKETSHGREEIRQYIQMPVPNDFPGVDRWAGLKTLGLVIRRVCATARNRRSRGITSAACRSGLSASRTPFAVTGKSRMPAICASTSPFE